MKEREKIFFWTLNWQPAQKQILYPDGSTQWRSKEVEPLTDSKSSSPFWKECRRGRIKQKSREGRDVRWKQCQLRAECIETGQNENHSSWVQLCRWHKLLRSSSCWQIKHTAKRRKACFLLLRFVSVLHLQTGAYGFLSQQICSSNKEEVQQLCRTAVILTTGNVSLESVSAT